MILIFVSSLNEKPYSKHFVDKLFDKKSILKKLLYVLRVILLKYIFRSLKKSQYL